MKCKEINDLLYLTEDEMPPHIYVQFKEHIATCAGCAAKYSEIKKADEIIAKIKGALPILDDDEEFTRSVMSAIEEKRRSAGQSAFGLLIDKVSLLFLNTAVRAAALSIIILIISTFIIQQYFVLSYVSTLENRLAVTETAPAYNASTGFDQLKGAKLVSDIFAMINGNRFYAELPTGLIVADKEKLNEFLSLYSSLQNYRKLYSKEIEADFPALNRFLDGKLTIEELQAFAKENEKALKDFGLKLKAGGK